MSYLMVYKFFTLVISIFLKVTVVVVKKELFFATCTTLAGGLSNLLNAILIDPVTFHLLFGSFSFDLWNILFSIKYYFNTIAFVEKIETTGNVINSIELLNSYTEQVEDKSCDDTLNSLIGIGMFYIFALLPTLIILL